MSDNVECPFCGVLFQPPRHPSDLICPVSTFCFTREQWAIRPQPAQPMRSEVEYLRSIVERMALRYVSTNYSSNSDTFPEITE